MKILHVIPTVNEEYGGPVAALREADAATRSRGIVRTVATLDLPQDPWVRRSPFETVPLGSPTARRGRRALPWLRYGFTPHLVPWLKRHAGRHDRIVVHGLWNYAAFAARRVLPGGPTPYFVFPHGMLDPWFRAAYPLKHGCKQASWWLSEGPLLAGARAVLFTSEGERGRGGGRFPALLPARDRGGLRHRRRPARGSGSGCGLCGDRAGTARPALPTLPWPPAPQEGLRPAAARLRGSGRKPA